MRRWPLLLPLALSAAAGPLAPSKPAAAQEAKRDAKPKPPPPKPKKPPGPGEPRRGDGVADTQPRR